MRRKFNNVPNKCIIVDGEEYWISRASAVCITFMVYKDGNYYILLSKRGKGCPDEVGKWNLICGYLDNNETLEEAAIRETYEESGLELDVMMQQNPDKVLFNSMLTPWRTGSDAKPGKKQNVTHHYGLVMNVDEFPVVSNLYCEPNEVDDYQWLSIEDLIDGKYDFEFAFNHDVISGRFVELYMSYALEMMSHIVD